MAFSALQIKEEAENPNAAGIFLVHDVSICALRAQASAQFIFRSTPHQVDEQEVPGLKRGLG